MKVGVKVSELIRQDISVRDDIEFVLPEFFLHLDDIVTQPVLPCQLKGLREVIYFLIVVQALIHERFQALACPKDIPVMGFSLHEVIALQDGLYQLPILELIFTKKNKT